MTETTTPLAIMFCPYCGSMDVHEVEMQGPSDGPNEVAAITCIGCNETCVIERAVEECDEVN